MKKLFLKQTDDRTSKVRGAALDAASARHQKLNAAVPIVRTKFLDCGDWKETLDYLNNWLMQHYGLSENSLRSYRKTIKAILEAEPEVKKVMEEMAIIRQKELLAVKHT